MTTMELSINALQKKVKSYQDCFEDLATLCATKGYTIMHDETYGFEIEGEKQLGFTTLEQAITSCIASWAK